MSYQPRQVPKQHFRWDLDWVSIGRLANIGRYFYNIGPITVDDYCSTFQPFNIGPIQLQYWQQLNFFWEFLTFHPQLYLFLTNLIVNCTLFYSRTHFKHLNFLYSCKFGPIPTANILVSQYRTNFGPRFQLMNLRMKFLSSSNMILFHKNKSMQVQFTILS